MQIQSKACCTRPPVQLSGGYDSYKLKGKYTEYDGMKTCKYNARPPTHIGTQDQSYLSYPSPRLDETGPAGAKRGIFVIYDVFGLYIQSLKGCDILAYDYDEQPDNAGHFQVFMPDFFGDHPQKMENFPPQNSDAIQGHQ